MGQLLPEDMIRRRLANNAAGNGIFRELEAVVDHALTVARAKLRGNWMKKPSTKKDAGAKAGKVSQQVPPKKKERRERISLAEAVKRADAAIKRQTSTPQPVKNSRVGKVRRRAH